MSVGAVKMNELHNQYPSDSQCKKSGPVSRLLASAVRNGSIYRLQKLSPEAVNLVSVSKACGTEGVDFDLIPKELRYEGGYMRRVIKADNLELFLKHRPTIQGEIYLLNWASKYCARKVMTSCGLSPNYVGEYIRKAILARNKNTLLFLVEGGFATSKQIGNIFCDLLTTWGIRFGPSFIVACFRSGLIVLNEEQWFEFERSHTGLYCLVQDDV